LKVILTGATGVIGAAALDELIAQPEVVKIACLTRKPLGKKHPKVVAILHEDFTQYAGALMTALEDYGACVWALGGKVSDSADLEDYTRVTHGFATAFAGVMATRFRDRFTFCYVSGMGADPSESSWLPWQKSTRHLKGRTERDLAALCANHPGLSVYSFRPGGVLPAGEGSWARKLLSPWVVGVEDLARALTDVALNGDRKPAGAYTLENGDIKERARQSRPAA